MRKVDGMKLGDKAGIVCCSNGQTQADKEKVDRLERTLLEIGFVPVLSEYLYEKGSVFSGSPEERAGALMRCYRDSEIKAIFDLSGGDIANELLLYLDYQVIGESGKAFWGYSDLTTIINGIYAKTGVSSVLYQIKNLIYRNAELQTGNFLSTVLEGGNQLFDFQYNFIQGSRIRGIVVGGNIRCLLKLAGTEYWPDMKEKVLLLEGYSGLLPQMTTYLCQLKQLGVFDKINGIILGTFTQMEKEQITPTMEELIKQYVGQTIPIVKTYEIGHGSNSKAIVIGKEIELIKG